MANPRRCLRRLRSPCRRAKGESPADFAEMLMRMYSRWAEDHGFSVELLYRSDAEEGGDPERHDPHQGDYAYGYLKGEMGQHRLVDG